MRCVSKTKVRVRCTHCAGRIQAKYVGQHGVLGGCPAAEIPELQPESKPEPEPEENRDQKQGVHGHAGEPILRGRGPSRRRLGSSAEFMRAELQKLKEVNGEDYEPNADDIDRMRAALVGQQ